MALCSGWHQHRESEEGSTSPLANDSCSGVENAVTPLSLGITANTLVLLLSHSFIRWSFTISRLLGIPESGATCTISSHC